MTSKNVFILLIALLSFSDISAQITHTWTGGAGTTNWQDIGNWNTNAVPGTGDYVVISTSVTIVGTAANAPARVIVNSGAVVTLDMDLTIAETAGLVNNIQVSGGTLNLGTSGVARVFNISTNGTSNTNIFLTAANSILIIASNTTVNLTQSNFGLRTNNATASIVNQGVVNISNYTQYGIQVVEGTLVNDKTINIDNGGTGSLAGMIPTNGTINNTTTGAITITNYIKHGIQIATTGIFNNQGVIDINTPAVSSLSGIVIGSNTTFNNNATGTITVTKALDDGIVVQSSGMLNNSGTINVTGQDAATASNTPLLNNGSFNNNSGGTLNADGGVSGTCRAIFNNTGTLTNTGTINASNGDVDRMIFNNSGTVTNSACGIINLTLGRILVNGGSFTNNGLYKTTHSSAGVNAAAGTATNNAFYTSNNANWAVGAGTGVDNGVKLSSSNFDVDAGSSCTPNLGIDAAHNWYSDVGATTQVGSNDASGSASFNNGAFVGSGPHTLYSCYGSDVTMTISNLAGPCLPVELISFEGIIKGEQVELNWTTASEQNNKGFDIERANEQNGALVWETIDFVEGHGTTMEEQNYFYYDTPLAKGINYYRLKQIDYDGAFEYSNVVSVSVNTNEQASNFKIYPNPTSNELNIENGIGQLTIFNLLGQVVKQLDIKDVRSSIQVGDLSTNTYLLKVLKKNGEVEVQYFVKQ